MRRPWPTRGCCAMGKKKSAAHLSTTIPCLFYVNIVLPSLSKVFKVVSSLSVPSLKLNRSFICGTQNRLLYAVTVFVPNRYYSATNTLSAELLHIICEI
jgi:hypothetical protein